MAITMIASFYIMHNQLLATIFAAVLMTAAPTNLTFSHPQMVHEQVLSQHAMSLEDRYPVQSVSDVFKDNILLTLYYLSGKVKDPSQINWDEIHKPFHYEMTLKPGEVFAFHNDVLPQYQGKTIVTTNATFGPSDGFRSDGYLYGDGVCHLASLINWAARDAGLSVNAPTNHNFAVIPEISREYGTAIYYSPGQSQTNEMQNLYVENNLQKPVHFVFDYKDGMLSVSVAEEK
jgi:hypothetical protein